MSRGWDEGGGFADYSSHRLICGNPPGCGGAGEGTGAFRPNVFCGYDLVPQASDVAPQVALGVGDLSLEVWFCWKKGRVATAPDARGFIGWMDRLAAGPVWIDAKAALEFHPTNHQVRAYYDDDVNAAPPAITVGAVAPVGWVHLAVNYQRAANMTLYIGGAAAGAVAINANNMGNARFYALVGELDNMWGNAALWDSATDCPGVVALIATHSRLLTAAEIRDSVLGRRVQNFGAAATRVCWDWRRVEGETGWETDELKIATKLREALEGRGVTAPLGAPGTVRVLDLSGNNRHWTLPTAATYGTTAATTANTGFLADPFWRS